MTISKHTIRPMMMTDISTIVTDFASHNWIKPTSIFKHYLDEQNKGKRLAWVAFDEGQFAGYVTLKWQSKYQHFNGIPEIMDLNVLPDFIRQGIGSSLLDIAEKTAGRRSNIVGLGVGLYADYGSAQRLYVKHGYVPNGFGVTYNYQSISPGNNVPLDDDLVLWFIKNLDPHHNQQLDSDNLNEVNR